MAQTFPKIPSFLVCPVCKGPLLSEPHDPSASSFELVCPSCGLAYAVKDGIPVMIASSARPLTPEEARAARAKRDALRADKSDRR